MPSAQIFAFIDWKTTTELIAATVALATLIKGTLEYIKQGAQKRTELFLQMREKYQKFRYICTLLDDLLDDRLSANASNTLRLLPWIEKRDFVGFFEELALMAESGLIRTSVVHYMFGYYAVECSKSDEIWNDTDGLKRDSRYWALFHSFANRMQIEEKKFVRQKFSPKKYRM